MKHPSGTESLDRPGDRFCVINSTHNSPLLNGGQIDKIWFLREIETVLKHALAARGSAQCFTAYRDSHHSVSVGVCVQVTEQG